MDGITLNAGNHPVSSLSSSLFLPLKGVVFSPYHILFARTKAVVREILRVK